MVQKMPIDALDLDGMKDMCVLSPGDPPLSFEQLGIHMTAPSSPSLHYRPDRFDTTYWQPGPS